MKIALVGDYDAAVMPLIDALACRLHGDAEAVELERGSRLDGIYQSEHIVEEYYCGYGVNPVYRSLFDDSRLLVCGRDGDGNPRAFELTDHRFFFGTAFRPERSVRSGATHPLVIAWPQAAA